MTKRETGIKAKRRRDGGGRVSATCVGHDRGPWEKACGRLGFAGSAGRGAVLEVKGGERGDAWGRRSARSAVVRTRRCTRRQRLQQPWLRSQLRAVHICRLHIRPTGEKRTDFTDTSPHGRADGHTPTHTQTDRHRDRHKHRHTWEENVSNCIGLHVISPVQE